MEAMHALFHFIINNYDTQYYYYIYSSNLL